MNDNEYILTKVNHFVNVATCGHVSIALLKRVSHYRSGSETRTRFDLRPFISLLVGVPKLFASKDLRVPVYAIPRAVLARVQ